MSTIERASREPVEGTLRKRLTDAQRDEVRARQFDLCGCGDELSDGPIEFDHVVPLELGGSNDLSNIEAMCVPCHKAKTREDIRRIAKAKRLARDNDPETRRRSPFGLRGRGFQGGDPLKGNRNG